MTRSHYEELSRLCDAHLIDRLRLTPAQVLRKVRALTGGAHQRPGGLTYLAVEAYLAHRTEGPIHG